MKSSFREASFFFLFLVSIHLFFAGGACPCREKPPKGPAVVPLKMVDLADYPWIRTGPWYLELQSGKATWDFGPAGGRVTFLEKGGKVYIDRNRDGKVDKADGEPLREETILEGRVPFRGGSARYAVSLRLWDTHPPILLLEPKSALAGRWGKTLFLFLDRNLDGRFFQFGVDTFVLAPAGKDGGRPPSRTFFYTLSRVVRVEGRLFLLDCGEGGEDLKLYPYPGKTGLLQVRADKKHGESLELFLGDPGRDLFFQVRGPGSFELPRRRYRVLGVTARFDSCPSDPGKKKPSGKVLRREARLWALSLYGLFPEKQPTLDLSGGKFVLDGGAPLRLDFEALVWGKDGNRLEISDVYLATPGGLKFRAEVFDREDTQTIEAYVRAGGKKRFLSKLEYG